MRVAKSTVRRPSWDNRLSKIPSRRFKVSNMRKRLMHMVRCMSRSSLPSFCTRAYLLDELTARALWAVATATLMSSDLQGACLGSQHRILPVGVLMSISWWAGLRRACSMGTCKSSRSSQSAQPMPCMTPHLYKCTQACPWSVRT